MKLGKLEIVKHKKYPVVAVKFNGKPLFYIENDGRSIADIIRESLEKRAEKKNQPVVKNCRLRKIVAGSMVAVTLATSVLFGCANIGNQPTDTTQETIQTQSGNTQKTLGEIQASSLDFTTMQYKSKTYLTLEEDDFLALIEQCMEEVDKEYVENGNKTVFNSKDTEYSQFTKYDILGLLQTESSLRLIEIKDEDGNIFDVNNYERFYGKDAAGVIYYGPGMMSEGAVDYIVNQDRLTVNNFKNYDSFKIGDKQVKITYENINPYDYVINSNATTKKEVKQALKENLCLNIKSIYVFLNRLVKDNVKIGTHDEGMAQLKKYAELADLSDEDKQKAYAYIAYNNGTSIAKTALMNGALFDKYTTGEDAGKYIINVKYADRVYNYANDFYEKLSGNNLID